MRLAVLVIGAAAVGCYQPAPPAGAPCNPDQACPGQLVCIDDHCVDPTAPNDATQADDAADAAPDACPGATCSGNDLIGCGAVTTCDLGCSTTPDAHCAGFVPSNGLTPALLVDATADVPGTQNWTFDTDNGEIRKGNITLRPGGSDVINGIRFTVVDGVGVFSANSFTQNTGNDWSFNGTRPAALYAATTIEIRAVIDASANASAGGPGGSSGNTSTSTSGCRGRAGRLIATNTSEGGGGGGGVTAGAIGASNVGGATGIGGTVCATPSAIPLRGGHGGGAGGASTLRNGGGGGGAIALVAMQRITINSGAAVAAPGDGGISTSNGESGGGGGGGGGVLIEAPIVEIHGAITANGGAGGAPQNSSGADGSVNTSTPAPGGSYTGPGGTKRGGNGAAGATSPTVGQAYFYDDMLGTVISRGGGGGGAAGRLEIRARTMDLTGMVQSPNAAQSDIQTE